MATAEKEAVRTMAIGDWVASNPARADAANSAALDGFEQWMAAEQRRVYLLCLRMLRNSEDADIATQDSFLKAYQVLRKSGAPRIQSPEKWITRIAINTCLDRLRSRRWLFWKQRVEPADERAVLQLTPTSLPNPEEAARARDLARRISAALGRLTPRQRSVFVLRHDEDLSLEEIGEVLGLDLGTVKSHVARALKKLRDELEDLYESEPLDR